MNHTETFKDIISALNKYEVEYLVVGGAAVGYYGYHRQSMARGGQLVDEPDLDIWFNPTPKNYVQMIKALEELKIDVSRLKDEQIVDPKKSFLRYTLDDCTLDLLPQIKAPIRFRDAYTRKSDFNRNGFEMTVIGVEDLITDKEASSRPKDLVDIAHLRAIYLPDSQ